MEIWFLAVIFLIVAILGSRFPLYVAVLGGIAAAVLLYRIAPVVILEESLRVFSDWNSLQVLLSIYTITYLQRMLERRHMIKNGKTALDELLHNHRKTVAVAPLFIGMLPSVAAMNLCGDIVNEAGQGHLEPKELSFLTSWMRHLPECMLPTNSSVLLLVGLAGMEATKFSLAMLPCAIVLMIIAYLPYIRKIPRGKFAGNVDRTEKFKELFRQLWPLMLLIGMIMLIGIPVVPAALITIAAVAIIKVFAVKELLHFGKSAFEWGVQLSTVLLFLLKNLLDYSGVIETMPVAFAKLPIPMYMVFVLLFIIGSLVTGATSIIALGAPIAFAALGAELPTLVLIMGVCHGANQISPVHICLEVAARYYGISMFEHIKKSIVPSVLFIGFTLLYYRLLLVIC